MAAADRDHHRQEDDMFQYFRSIQGRLLALGIALPLLAAAKVPFHAESIGFFTFPLIIGICLAFFAVGFSLDAYPRASIAAILLLPPALFLYVILVGIVAPMVHGVVYAMAAAACALLVIAARPGLPVAPKHEARVARHA
jgi:FtsH-binding integral membrane protein